MRIATTALAAALAVVLAACGGSSTTSEPTAVRTAATTQSPPTAKTAAPPTTTQAGAVSTPAAVTDEVTGIVGSVIASTNTIAINHVSGAAVTKISIDSSTVIRRAAGGPLTLSGVHPSDRIIAKGHLNDRKDALVATEITVQDVVPGGQPGG